MRTRVWTMVTATVLAMSAGSAAAAKLDVEVSGLEKKGRLMLAVVDSEGNWSSGEALVSVNARVTASTMKFCFDVPHGTVAVRVFHDENGNGELDQNLLGIPKEGYGFSNNPRVMGPASFKDAALSVPQSGARAAIEIQ